MVADMRWALWMSLLAALAGPAWCEEPVKLTVCELFADLTSFSGRLVELSGRLRTNRHGWWLEHKDCPNKFRGPGGEWPTDVALSRAGSQTPEPSVSFDLDRDAVDRVDKLMSFLGSWTAEELGVEITGTFVGELRTRREYSSYRSRTGGLTGGFGHLGGSPALLVCKTVKEIVIRQKPGLGR